MYKLVNFCLPSVSCFSAAGSCWYALELGNKKEIQRYRNHQNHVGTGGLVSPVVPRQDELCLVSSWMHSDFRSSADAALQGWWSCLWEHSASHPKFCPAIALGIPHGAGNARRVGMVMQGCVGRIVSDVT